MGNILSRSRGRAVRNPWEMKSREEVGGEAGASGVGPR